MADVTSSDASRRDAIIRVLAVLGVVLLACITLNKNSATRIFSWPWWGWWRLTLAIPMVLLLVSGLRSRGRPLAAGVGAPLFAFGAIYLLAAGNSVHPATSLAYSATLLSALCLVCVVAREPKAGRFIPIGIATAGVVYATASVIAWFVLHVLPHWENVAELNTLAGAAVVPRPAFGPRNPLLLGHWNYTAGLGVLTIPWVVALAWRGRGWTRALWLAGGTFVVVAIASAMSRGAWLGLAGAAAMAVIAWVAAARWRWQRTCAVALVAILVAAGTTLLVPRLRATAIAVFTGEGLTVSDEQRLAMAEVGGMMVRDHWVLGQGAGLTPRLYPAYRALVDGGVETAFQLHSAPLQLAVDAGLPAAALALAIIVVVFVHWWRELARTPGPADAVAARWPHAVAGISLVGYGVYSLTDYQLDVPVIVALAAATFGLLCRRLDGTIPPSLVRSGRRMDWIAPVTAGLMLLGFIGITIPESHARLELAAGVAAAEASGATDDLDTVALRLADARPDDPQPLVAAAVTHLRLGYAAADEAAAGRHRGMAAQLLQRALALEPALEFAHYNLGWLELPRAPASALEHFRQAQRLVPDRSGVYFGLGLAQLEAGERDRAVDALALELLNDPRFATSPAWDTEILRDLREPALRRATAIAADLSAKAPAREQAAASYVAELFRWLLEGDIEPVRAAAPEAARPWFTPAPAGEVAVITATMPDAHALAAVVNATEHREALLHQLLVMRLRRAPTDVEVELIGKLVRELGTDWRAWLNAPEGRDAPFALVRRNHRPAYATLAYNLDIPVPYDAFVVQENQLVGWLFASFFPARGHLPDTWLIAHVRAHGI